MSGQNYKTRNLSSDDLHRFAELGRLSASLLHEISSPLTVAMLHLDQVGDQTSQSIKHIRRNLTRLTLYVNAARGQLKNESVAKSFFIDSQIRDIKRLSLPAARAAYVKLKIAKAPHVRLVGDPLHFQQILVNLIINAIDAYPKSGLLDPTRLVLVNFEVRGNSLVILVKDNGSGINREQLKRVFEPFYTTKSGPRQGLGLGLVIVSSYVTQGFKGSISVSSSVRHGTCFKIKLPLM